MNLTDYIFKPPSEWAFLPSERQGQSLIALIAKAWGEEFAEKLWAIKWDLLDAKSIVYGPPPRVDEWRSLAIRAAIEDKVRKCRGSDAAKTWNGVFLPTGFDRTCRDVLNSNTPADFTIALYRLFEAMGVG